jgi:O-antigen/teichoic acid export membrane protein
MEAIGKVKISKFKLFKFKQYMKITKHDAYFFISLIFAIYFAMVCGAWIYFMNFIVGIPTFLISYTFWKNGKKKDPKINRYKYIPYLWRSGIVVSIISLIGYLIFN